MTALPNHPRRSQSRAWLDDLARSLITVPLTPAIAVTACSLPGPFSDDPADRQIYATAANLGWPLVSKDRRLQDYAEGDVEVVW